MARPEVTGRKPGGSTKNALDDGDAYSIEEFCRKHRISVPLFYKFEDEMPDTFYVGTRRLISREARARWVTAREAAAKKAATAVKTTTETETV